MNSHLIAVIITTSVFVFLSTSGDGLRWDACTYELWVTPHVAVELRYHQPAAITKLEELMYRGIINETPCNQTQVLREFGLFEGGQLGRGECAAAAASHVLKTALAIDDPLAREVIASTYPGVALIRSGDLLADLVARSA